MRTLNTFALEIQRCQEDREPSRVSLVLSAAAAPTRRALSRQGRLAGCGARQLG